MTNSLPSIDKPLDGHSAIRSDYSPEVSATTTLRGSTPPGDVSDSEASIVSATLVDGLLSDRVPRSWPLRTVDGIKSAWEWCFGLFSLLIGLAILASIPVLSFLSLGYLLEVSGRVARTGSIWQGFVGVRKAARVGSLVLGTWLMMFPLRAISDLWYSSQIIDRASNATRFLRLGLVAAVVLMVLHLLWAWFRGGRLRHFFWPAPRKLVRRLREGHLYSDACDRVWEF